MRHVIDSFLMLLSNELTGIPIHHLVNSPDYPDSGLLKQNALNVSFLTTIFHPHINQTMVSLDVLNEDQYTAISWLEQIQNLLSKRYFTEQKNWTTPSAPTNIDGNIYWEKDAIVFRPIPVSQYSQYNCSFFLKYYATLS